MNWAQMNWAQTRETLIKINSNFSGLPEKWAWGINLSRADLTGADLSRANLTGADLSRADLTGADLSRANLTRANLSGADLTRANLSEANLSEANLSRANLSGADLTRANLTRANLSGADLTRANLSEANLSEANLTRANLIGANLSEADLSEANLTRANLSGADLRRTCLDDNLRKLQRVFTKQCPPLKSGGRIVYRTNDSQHAGNTNYLPGHTYIAPVLSADIITACHPGIYAASLEWMKENYPNKNLVRCYVRDGDWFMSAKGAVRCKRLRVLSVVKKND